MGKEAGRLSKRITGITKRWLINGLGTVFLFLMLLVWVFTLIMRNTYYSQVESTLRSYANASNDLFARYASVENFDFDAGFREFVANFRDKETVEIQLINKDGKIVLTSSGFERSDETAPEWDTLKSGSETVSSWRGKTSSGEEVLSVCSRMMQDGKGEFGLRYVVSLRLVNGQLGTLTLVVAAVAALVLFFVMLSNAYFVSTIINPVKEIGRSARSIALGHYETRIEKRYNDEIGELSDTINYMAGEIANAEQTKNEFISSVSHELRTPLTSIKGSSETLSELGTEDKELTQKGLKVIADESDRLARIVEDLLDFSRMQGGRFSVQMEEMDLLAELEDIALLYRQRAQKSGVRIQYVENTHATLQITADRQRIRQVLVNVLDNAVKYSGRGGKVRVEAAEVGDSAQVVISDTGRGISEADLPHVKDRFFRASKSGGVPGSGIGLAVADEIVSAHGGSLSIESKEGVGTTVIITLPKTQPTPSDNTSDNPERKDKDQ